MPTRSKRWWLFAVPIVLIAIALSLPTGSEPSASPLSTVAPAPSDPPQPIGEAPSAWEALPDAGSTSLTETMFAADGMLLVSVKRAGVPVEGADVRVYFDPAPPLLRAIQWRIAGRGLTAKDGTLRLNARLGHYLVAVRKDSARTLHDFHHMITERETAVPIELSDALAVRGVVTDKNTGAPLASAEVSRGYPGEFPPEESQSTRSDLTGRFTLPGLAAQTFTLTFTAKGYLPARREVILDTKLEPLAIALSPMPKVTGVVRSANRALVEGATVTASNRHWSTTTASGPDGKFSLDCIEGEMLVGAQKVGATSQLSVAQVSAQRAPVPIELVLRDAAAIEGQVVRTPEGEPVVGAAVVAHISEEGMAIVVRYSTTSDESGHFLLSELPAGKYTVTAIAEGQCSMSEVSIAVGKPSPLRVELAQGAWIEGTVVDSSARPIAHTVMDLITQPPQQSMGSCPFDARTVRTDETGAFRFDGLAPGLGRLVARHPYLRSGEVKMVTLTSATGATERFVLGEAGTLRAVVRARGGGPLPENVRVEISDSMGGGMSSRVKSDGTCTARVAPGKYTVKAEVASNVRNPIIDRQPPGVTVEAGKETVVELLVDPPEPEFKLRVRVVDAAGAPADARYSYMLKGHGSGSQTDKDGIFVVEARVADAPEGVRIKAWNEVTSSEEVVVTDFTKEVTLPLRKTRRVEGRVRDVSGRAVVQFSLQLKPFLDPGENWRTPRAYEGDSFVFEMAPVEAELEAVLPDGRVGAVRLTPSPEPARIELIVGAPGSIRFRAVSAATGKPISGLGGRALRDERLEEARATTGADGVGILTPLRPGEYDVDFFVRGLVKRTLTLGPGEAADLGDVEFGRSSEPGAIGVAFEPRDDGLEVIQVLDGSGAEAAGIEEGDVLAIADGHRLLTQTDAMKHLKGAPGSKVSVTYRRGNETRTAIITRSR